MDILALDLGTSAGVAYNRGDEVTLETLTLASSREIREWGKQRLTRRNDPRITRFATYLEKLGDFDLVIFEDVQFSSYTLQVQLWSALRAAAWLFASADLFECVPVARLKKFATGHGGATKEMMSAAMKRRFPEAWNGLLSDDAIDAFWLHQWAITKFRK